MAVYWLSVKHLALQLQQSPCRLSSCQRRVRQRRNEIVYNPPMNQNPTPDRPRMPPGYGVGDPQYGFEPIQWSWVVERMTDARNYWVATARADGGPHLSPVWGLWHDDAFHFFTDPDSLKARNIRRDPRAVVHLESGDEVVIMEGTLEPASATPDIVSSYESKYGISLGDAPEGLYRLKLTKALAWLESDFPKTATRWRF